MENGDIIFYLNYLVRTYDGLTKLITATKQRLGGLPGNKGEGVEADEILIELEKTKGKLSRKIEKAISAWPVWEEWLININGIGPAIAGKLILLYYYKFIPVCEKCGGELQRQDGECGLICSECGKKAKGEGVLKYKIAARDFPTISKWWAYLGMHTVDGVKPKRKKGQQANWSTPGRTLCYMIADQFNRKKEDDFYKAFFLERKRRHERKHPDWSKGHRHNAAGNETAKLFLAHFWQVAREIDGLHTSQPYSGAIMGHTNIINPPQWESEQ